MKKLVATMALGLLTVAAWAQPTGQEKDEVAIAIEGSKLTIESGDLANLSELDLNAMIAEVTRHSMKIQNQRKALMAQVDEALNKEEISEEQAEDMREMINERTEENVELLAELMEAWGETQEARLEAWEAEYEAGMEAWEVEYEKRMDQGNYAMPPLPPLPMVPPVPPAPPVDSNSNTKIIISEKGIEINRGKDGEEPFAFKFNDEEDEGEEESEEEAPSKDNKKIDGTEGYFDFNLGFNQMMTDGKTISGTGADELNFWRSNEWNFSFGYKTRLGSPYSKVYLRYGAEFSFHDFKLLDENIMAVSDSNIFFMEDTINDIKSSKYKMAYFNIPVMLQLDFSKLGQMDESFTLGVGGYVGVRLSAKRLLEFNNPDLGDVEQKAKDDFFTEQFRYGLMAQVGFDSFKITAKYDLNNYFKENKGPNYQMASVTIGWTL